MRRWIWIALGVAPSAMAGTTYFPGPSSFGTLMFEDRFPCAGDADFNDVVLRYAYRKTDVAGQDTHLTATLHVVAAGASYDNGLALRLPVPFGAVGSVTLRVGDAASADGAPWGPPEVLVPEDVGGEPVLWLVDDLRAWCGGATGFLNTDPARDVVRCAPVLVDVAFPGGTTVPASEPYDLFVHRSGHRPHQIHRSPYYPLTVGSGAFDDALFGSCNDGSDGVGGSRWFVQGASGPVPGLPFALNVGEGIAGGTGDGLHWWMQEQVRIDVGAPRIVEFADGAGDGDPGWDWYKSGTEPAAQFTSGAGAPPPTPTPTPLAAYDADADGWCVGFDDDASGGTPAVCFAGGGTDDCDDLDPARNPGLTEVWYDGVDADCGFDDDYDQDADGDPVAPFGGDCADLDTARSSLVAEGCNGIDDDCDTFVDDGVLGTAVCPAAACADIVDDEGVGRDGTFTVHDPSTGVAGSLTCLNSYAGGGWYQCASVDYVANTSTITRGRTGQQIGACASCQPPGAPSGPNAYLGVGTTAAIKSQCFGWFSETDVGITSYAAGSGNDWDYWQFWDLPSGLSPTVSYFLRRPGTPVSCDNGYTAVNAPTIDANHADYLVMLFGSETTSLCYENGVYRGGSESFWLVFPAGAHDEMWLELSDDHYSRLGRYMNGTPTAVTGGLSFWVR